MNWRRLTISPAVGYIFLIYNTKKKDCMYAVRKNKRDLIVMDSYNGNNKAKLDFYKVKEELNKDLLWCYFFEPEGY